MKLLNHFISKPEPEKILAWLRYLKHHCDDSDCYTCDFNTNTKCEILLRLTERPQPVTYLGCPESWVLPLSQSGEYIRSEKPPSLDFLRYIQADKSGNPVISEILLSQKGALE